MGMDPTIRRATRADASAVSELLSQLGYGVPPEEVASRLDAPFTTTLVAEFSGFLVGVVVVSVRPLMHLLHPRASIDTMVVDQETRSLGIGHRLVEAAIEISKVAGARVIEVHSNLRREGADRFFEREGFETTSRYFVRSLSD